MTARLPESIERSVNEAMRSDLLPSVDDALAAAWIAFHSPPGDQPTSHQEPLTQVVKPIREEILELTADVPDEEFLKLPADGAVQHDHYLHGLPKRPISCNVSLPMPSIGSRSRTARINAAPRP